jgi:putative (di)nucleoside polyphosphate hydrolase
LPYRSSVGVMLLNTEGFIFVGRRTRQTVYGWQMPQGGIELHETPETAALRELEEEIGTRNAKLLRRYPGVLSYDLPAHLVGVGLKGRYRGQQQQWLAMRFLGSDADINLATCRSSKPDPRRCWQICFRQKIEK